MRHNDQWRTQKTEKAQRSISLILIFEIALNTMYPISVDNVN
jgi:hypothetical protein